MRLLFPPRVPPDLCPLCEHVVLVSAQWCGPCQRMKKTVIPQIEKRGLFDQVTFAAVNVDRERTLARKLIGNGAGPQPM